MDKSPKFSRLTKICVKEVDSDVIFQTGYRNMSCAMKNVYYNLYHVNSSVTVDSAMGQTPRSTERISSLFIYYDIESEVYK